MKSSKRWATKKLAGSLLAVTIAASLAISGCNKTEPAEPPIVNTPTEDHTDDHTAPSISSLHELLKQPGNLPQALDWLQEHADGLSDQDVSSALLAIEDTQLAEFESYIDRYYEGNVQERLSSIFEIGDSLDQLIERTADDEALHSLLTETKRSGYLLSSAEGMFSPEIDYTAVANIAGKSTDEIRAYFELRARESQEPSFRDAALMIDWGELVQRALIAEQYTIDYRNSPRMDEVTSMLNNYRRTVFYGVNNTPLFSYDSQVMDSDAQAAYETILKEETNISSPLLQNLSTWMQEVSKQNYMLTDAVEKLRGTIISTALAN